ncbi:MAG: alpha/beta fold hydrolase [Candidatus Omnitrophota bacterium]|nr:alpha/beta fold hydrolase [Candidatus Omnitrophota bacterium]
MSVVWSFRLKEIQKEEPSGRTSGNGFTLKGDNGATVVLIHGLTGTPNEMRFLANYLNKKGYTVICPRLAYHGDSIRVLKHAKWEEFYESVRKIFTEGELGDHPGPIFTGGLSMGALLALLLADEFSDKVKGVCCLAPTLFYDGWNTPWARFILPLGYFTPLRHFAYFKEEPPYGIKNEAIQNRIHKYYSTATLDNMQNVEQYGYPYFPVAQLCQLKYLVRHITRRLPHIKIPVQLVQAKDDDMTSVKNSKYIYDKIGSSMKEIVLLYDSYHVVTADQERDTVAAKMEAFFQNAQR